jgi:acetyl esterase/lipase
VDVPRIAPELQKSLERLPSLPLDAPWARVLVQALLPLMPAAKVDGVRLEILGGHAPPLRVYHPETRRSPSALLWIHGGGYLVGRAVQDDWICAATALALGVVVVSVDYRVGPKHPFPAPLDDCYAAWAWLQAQAGALGIDLARVAVGGQSAGAGLAACLVQRLCDSTEPKPAAQWLLAPMLDDRTAARRELDTAGYPLWNNRKNAAGWRSLLGVEPGAMDVPAYAVAARKPDLGGLPKTWIGVGDVDLFFDEDRAYAERLRASGVDVTFEVVSGAPHGFEIWARDSALARAYIEGAQAWLGRALEAV